MVRLLLASQPKPREPMTFIPDQPYEFAELASADIREDFADLCFTHNQDPQELLDKLAGYLSASMLGEFMDDLAMGRV